MFMRERVPLGTLQDAPSLGKRRVARMTEFTVERGGDVRIHFGPGSYFLQAASVRGDVGAVADQWDAWMDAMADLGVLISGRVYDVDFEVWQNERDPERFLREGRSLGSRRLVVNACQRRTRSEWIRRGTRDAPSVVVGIERVSGTSCGSLNDSSPSVA